MTGPAPVLPLLQPGGRDTKILTNFHLDPRDEDAQACAAFEYAHLALGRLLITSPEYTPDTIRATPLRPVPDASARPRVRAR